MGKPHDPRNDRPAGQPNDEDTRGKGAGSHASAASQAGSGNDRDRAPADPRNQGKPHEPGKRTEGTNTDASGKGGIGGSPGGPRGAPPRIPGQDIDAEAAADPQRDDSPRDK